VFMLLALAFAGAAEGTLSVCFAHQHQQLLVLVWLGRICTYMYTTTCMGEADVLNKPHPLNTPPPCRRRQTNSPHAQAAARRHAHALPVRMDGENGRRTALNRMVDARTLCFAPYLLCLATCFADTPSPFYDAPPKHPRPLTGPRVTTVGPLGVATSTTRATPLVRRAFCVFHAACVVVGFFARFCSPTPVAPTHPH
jgi:hypothetical protein